MQKANLFMFDSTIKPTDAALNVYNSMRRTAEFYWIGLAIVEEKEIAVIHTESKDRNSNFEDAWNRLLAWLSNEMAAKPCHIVVNVNKIENGKNSSSNHLIPWIPEDKIPGKNKTKTRMLYSTSRNSLREEFRGLSARSIDAFQLSDISLDEL